MADGVPHTHGDNGTQPADGRDFQDGGYPDPEEFDWFWSQVPSAINDHKNTIEAFIAGTTSVGLADNANALEGSSLSQTRSHDHSTLTNINPDDHHAKTDSLQEIADADPVALVLSTYANASSTTADRVIITTDNNGVYYDAGSGLELVAEHPSNIGSGDLGFDPLTQTEAENNYVQKSGSTMSGDLNMESTMDANNTGGRVVLPVGTDMYAQ
jgi:hypothetical protein